MLREIYGAKLIEFVCRHWGLKGQRTVVVERNITLQSLGTPHSKMDSLNPSHPRLVRWSNALPKYVFSIVIFTHELWYNFMD